tara:strand:+ start:4082 stop:4621 length:540 start_codon:yes stop_codon:yes gene_type:complete
MIIDNFLKDEDWNYCYEFFKKGYWQFPNLSNITGNQGWRIFNPDVEKAIGEKLYNRFTTCNSLDHQQIKTPYAVQRVGINGATALNESHLHQDGTPKDLSLIWFGSKEWKNDWAGALQIHQDDKIHRVPYVPNRAVLFNSNLFHMPETPSEKNKLRISVGLHLTPASKWEYIYKPRVQK